MPKWARVSEDVGLGFLTHFLRIPAIRPSQVPQYPEEFTAVMAKEDLTFIQNMSKAEMAELLIDASHSCFQTDSLFSLAVEGRGMSWP